MQKKTYILSFIFIEFSAQPAEKKNIRNARASNKKQLCLCYVKLVQISIKHLQLLPETTKFTRLSNYFVIGLSDAFSLAIVTWSFKKCLI